MTRPGPVRRRGVAVGVVLVVGLGSLLIVAGLLHVVRSGVVSLGGVEDRVQGRLAARSAVRILARDLHRLRPDMLAGATPDLPEEFDVLEIDDGGDGRVAVARLLPLGPGGASLVSENAKLDLNLVDAGTLESTGILDPTQAGTVVAARDARPGGRFTHLSDLLALEGDGGIPPETLLGPLDELSILSRVDVEDDIGERIGNRLEATLGSSDGSTPLSDVLTIHAFEPDVDRNGEARFLLSSSTVETLGLDELGPERRAIVEAMMGSTAAPDAARDPAEDEADEADESGPRDPGSLDEVEFVRRLWAIADRNGGDAGLMLDDLTLVDGGWRNGLVDINRAPIPVLRALPGVDEELATAIVARRDSLDDARRFDRFWPVVEGLVEPDAWFDAVPSVTTRSLVWRAAIAVGFVSAEEGGPALRSPVVWEVVVDCGGDRPRIVELRDITMLELAARLVPAEEGIDSAARSAGSDESMIDEAAGDIAFPEESFLQDEPLFPGTPLMEELDLFESTPLFEDDPFFDGPASPFDVPGGRSPGSPTDAGRDRGPGGRWRPAT